MPGGDRTGPRGEGPMTGRAAGYCGGYASPGYMSSGAGYSGRWPGRGGMRGGRGIGGGRGMRHRHIFYATGLPRWMRGGSEALPGIEALRNEEELLEQRLGAIRERLRSLEKDPGGDTA